MNKTVYIFLKAMGALRVRSITLRHVPTRSRILSRLGLIASAVFALPLTAQPVPLGSATGFAVLGGSAVTNTGATVVTGDLGISPGNASSVTGFPPGQVIGTLHAADATALAAQNSVTTAYNDLAGRACATTISADLGGLTLVPGVYCSASSMGLTGTLTLDAQGDPAAVFVFQVGSTLTTASNAMVNVINSGQNCNVFWQIGSSATLGTTTNFAGSLLALSSVTLNTGASTNGRVFARNGAVTLDGNGVTLCTLAGVNNVALAKSFSPDTINVGGVSTLTIMLSNPNATDATLTAALVDTLPVGVLIAPLPNVATSCTGVGAPIALAGGGTVTLPLGRLIPANGSCTLNVDVTAAQTGSYLNTLPIAAVMTSNGNNPVPAVATLIVIAGSIATIPALSQWALLSLCLVSLVIGALSMHRST
jgi:hypothetical protein